MTSGDILEYLKVNKSIPEKVLHRLLPAGTPGMCTILYHNDDTVAHMEVPTIQSQRVVTKPERGAGAQLGIGR